MGGIGKALEQLQQLWGKLGARARTSLVAVAVLGLVAAIGVGLYGGGPKRVLFSGLEPRDAAAVVAALDGAKIPYALGNGGTTIEVPSADVDRARLMLAEQDLPKTGNVGFELFAEQSFGLTEFAQKVNYRRALQGELERTIGALDPIATVRVHITQPDRAVFEDEKTPTTASVTVDLRAGRELSDRQVGAIRHLVASAVEGLEPGDVTVVTTEGALLSRGGTDEANAAALDYESDLERDLENRVARLLERTVGTGGVEVTVAAEVDFSHTESTEETYDPEQTALRSESLQEAHEGAGASRPLGVAGAESNQPGAAPAATAADADASSKLVRARNFEVNKTVVHTVGPKALVKRLSVAVLVDGHYTPVEGAPAQFSPRTTEELAELQAVVENAMGYNAARGDRVKVASVQFRDRADDDAAGLPAGDAIPMWMMAAAGGGVLLLVVVVMRMRKKKPARIVANEVLQLPQTVSAAQAAIVRAENGAPMLQGAANLALPEAPEGARERVLALAAGDPERTADIVRAWLRADQPT